MNFTEAVEFLYSQLPMYQRVGPAAMKKDLSNTIFLLDYLGNPHRSFKSVHIAGTNGKGSSAHFIASVLQSAGYKTGLYTSPHLKSFTERIRINGGEIPETDVVEFVEKVQPLLKQVSPSFFEITVAMAFNYFAKQKVDIAVVEVGLGGRLDSTNVIFPEVCLITNISLDHMDMLGNTLTEIAGEKAGIIKHNCPVVIGKRQEEVAQVFIDKALESDSNLFFADELIELEPEEASTVVRNSGVEWLKIFLPGSTNFLTENIPGVLQTIQILREKGFDISDEHIINGLQKVRAQTGLKGRWQTINRRPLAICDVAHNSDGIRKVLSEIEKLNYNKLRMVWGSARDKEVNSILKLLPQGAEYYFCQADIPRAMDAEELHKNAQEFKLHGRVIKDVNKAFQTAMADAGDNDLIFVGGSTFVVAELENI